MAKTAELEINQAQVVADQEDVIRARITVDIRKKRPRLLNRVDDPFKLSAHAQVGANAHAVEAALQLLDTLVEARNILGLCPDRRANGSEEPFKLRRVTDGRRMKCTEASRKSEQCLFCAVGLLLKK